MQVRRTISETLYYLVRMFRAGQFGTAGRRLPTPALAETPKGLFIDSYDEIKSSNLAFNV